MKPTAFGIRASLLAVAAIAGGCQTSPDHESLREAERAFARHAEATDVRTAFRAAFADDGIWMVPAPMTLREAHAQRPPPADPRAVRLEWGPVASGIAASGDFGFTSGPSTLSLRDGSRPPQHGAFFSVWKRDAQGRWRVALDVGTASPAPIPPEALLPSPVVLRPSAPASPVPIEIERMRRLEADAFVDLLAADARFYRNGPPIFGASAIRAALGETFPMALEPKGGDVASSSDLAFTYGAWHAQRASGYYVHLWTRDARGAWKIAVAISLAGG
jgi:ketosteroid isomerase-like protein